MRGALLNAKLPNPTSIFLRLPEIPGPKGLKYEFVRLNKSLCGLREAPKLRFSELSKALQILKLFGLQTVIVFLSKTAGI